jgi:5-methylcytosine-specific restriction protein B
VPPTSAVSSQEEIKPLPETDPILAEVRAAIDMKFAGVILSGPPGTGKSWYAKRIAEAIAGNAATVRLLQFHASYQYEDFMEGFVPREGSGFVLQKKTFTLLCDDAFELPNVTHVLVIDEISRCDVARVFGEALTYLEMDKRGIEFTLSSGSVLTVPQNLIIIGTMNPCDKGVDELDVALERRFAQIDIPPSVTVLCKILADDGADPALIMKVAEFFEGVQGLDDEMVHLGHAYFKNCVDEISARQAWKFRLLPFFTKACRLNKEMLAEIKRRWLKAFPELQNKLAQDPPATEGAQQ